MPLDKMLKLQKVAKNIKKEKQFDNETDKSNKPKYFIEYELQQDTNTFLDMTLDLLNKNNDYQYYFEYKNITKLNEYYNQKIINILLTYTGEKVMNVDFGSNLKDVMQENLLDIDDNIVKKYIEDSLKKELDNVEVKNVYIQYDDENNINILIDYYLTDINKDFSISFNIV